MTKSKELPREGSRVKVKSLGIKGTINFLDYPNLYNDFMAPVQIHLDKPYDNSGHDLIRTDLKDIKRLRKPSKGSKRRKKK